MHVKNFELMCSWWFCAYRGRGGHLAAAGEGSSSPGRTPAPAQTRAAVPASKDMAAGAPATAAMAGALAGARDQAEGGQPGAAPALRGAPRGRMCPHIDWLRSMTSHQELDVIFKQSEIATFRLVN